MFGSKKKRVPVVLQMSAADCGAACLTMVLRHLGSSVSLRECQAAVGGGQGGVTALMIVQAARELGLDVQAFRHSVEGVANASLPAIVHWQGVHFVVLESWSAKGVQIIDPAVGRRTLAAEAFAERYSGVTLCLAPAATFVALEAERARGASPAAWRSYVRRVLAVEGGRQLLGLLLVASLLLQLAGLLLPGATWLVVETVLPNLQGNSLLLLGMAIFTAAVAQALVLYWRSSLVIRLQKKLDSHLMPDFFNRLLRLPYQFFQHRSTGDLISRLEGNAVVREMITSGILTGLLDGGLALLYLIVLYVQAPSFGWVVTLAAVIQFALLACTSERVHEYSQMALATQAEEDGFAVQVLRGIESIKGTGAEQWTFGQWHKRFDQTLEAAVVRGRYVAQINTVLQFLTFATPLLLLWIGVGAVQAGQLSLGQMLALVVLASSSLAPLGSLVTDFHRAQQIWAYLERLADVLETEPEEPDEQVSGRAEPLQLGGRIDVSHVAFRYGKGGGFDLQDISFSVAPGEKVAIVGASGAGKSTLIRLLLGLYRPETGTIAYDGRALDELGVTRLRQAVGVVLQDSFMLSGTIRENIALYRSDMPLGQVIEAARLAAIHDEIERLPMGYETRVGEGGSGLSGGQRQRVALARALAIRPAILLLDEATSHLDSATENKIFGALDELQATQLIIAHRLSTVRNADRVMVFEGGRIVEVGPPDWLAGQAGVYRELLRAQRV